MPIAQVPSPLMSILAAKWYNAAWFSGTTPEQQIQNALFAAAADGAFGVFIPGGDWPIVSGLNVPTGISLKGEGRATHVSAAGAGVNLVILPAGSSNIEITDIFFEGVGANQTDLTGNDSAIYAVGSSASPISDVLVTRCYFEKLDDAITVGYGVQWKITDNTFKKYSGAALRGVPLQHSTFENNIADGDRTGIGNGQAAVNFVWLSSGATMALADISFNNTINGNVGKNFSFEGILVIATRNTISNNVIDTALNGCTLQSGSSETVQPVLGGTYNTVVGNIFRNIATGFAAIRIGHSSGNNTVAGHHNLVSSNIVIDSSVGVDLQQDASDNLITSNRIILNGLSVSDGTACGGAATSFRNTINDNFIQGAGRHGIFIQNGAFHVVRNNTCYLNVATGINCSTATDLLISGNVCTDNDALTTGAGHGIVINSGTRIALIGNKCYVSNTSFFQQRGIIVAAAVTGFYAVANDCRNNRLTSGGFNYAGGAETNSYDAFSVGDDQTRIVRGHTTLTYGATVNTDCQRADFFLVTATNGTAFTMANPTAMLEGQEITYLIDNNSGGALGAITWGTEFNLAGAFVNPANGQIRTITFVRRNSKWRETSRSAADQPR